MECDRKDFKIFSAYESYFRNPNRIKDADIQRIPKGRERLYCTTPPYKVIHYLYGNSFYSYIHGLVHVIVLNTYTDTRKDSIQYNWLVDELEHNVNRTITPWVIVVSHTNYYTCVYRTHGTSLIYTITSFWEANKKERNVRYEMHEGFVYNFLFCQFPPSNIFSFFFVFSLLLLLMFLFTCYSLFRLYQE